MASMLNITLGDLTDEECIGLVNTVSPIINAMFTEPTHEIRVITDEMAKSRAKLEAALGRKIHSELTAIMDGHDDGRDYEIDMIEDGINYNLRRKQAKLQNAAHLLNDIYKDAFGSGVSRNNTIETTQIDSFLKGIESPEAQQAIQDINLTLEIEALVEAHGEYIKTKAERAEIKHNDDTPLLAPTRQDLHSDIVFLEKHIEFHHRKGSAVHTELAGKLSTPISEIMSVARARATRKENGSAN